MRSKVPLMLEMTVIGATQACARFAMGGRFVHGQAKPSGWTGRPGFGSGQPGPLRAGDAGDMGLADSGSSKKRSVSKEAPRGEVSQKPAADVLTC